MRQRNWQRKGEQHGIGGGGGRVSRHRRGSNRVKDIKGTGKEKGSMV